MDLFRKAGRKFEETKRAFIEEAEVEYVCGACEKPVTQEYDECPHCGTDAIVSTDEMQE